MIFADIMDTFVRRLIERDDERNELAAALQELAPIVAGLRGAAENGAYFCQCLCHPEFPTEGSCYYCVGDQASRDMVAWEAKWSRLGPTGGLK